MALAPLVSWSSLSKESESGCSFRENSGDLLRRKILCLITVGKCETQGKRIRKFLHIFFFEFKSVSFNVCEFTDTNFSTSL